MGRLVAGYPRQTLLLFALLMNWAAVRSASRRPSHCCAFLSTLRGGANVTMEEEETDPWIPLGGGAVNERKRRVPGDPIASVTTAPLPTPRRDSHYEPSQYRAHLWHALEGLHRYPNYLNRWSETDMGRLEQALEEQLSTIRAQRQAVLERRQGIRLLVDELAQSNDEYARLIQRPADWAEVCERVLHPDMVKAVFGSIQFAAKNQTYPQPPLEQVLDGDVTVDLDAGRLQALMDEEMFDVYSFPLFQLDFCRLLRDFVAALTALSQSRPELASLRVGRRPFDLDSIGLGWVNDLLFQLVIRPMSRHLFQATESQGDLDWRHGFIAGYSASPSEGKPRERLITHTDDAEVTLNLCLGADFTGGEVVFRGLRGTEGEGQVIDTFVPEPGRALLHAGRHFHDVMDVTSGERFALIVWARSWQGVRSNTCPCCWLNRRQDNSCVCGSRWN